MSSSSSATAHQKMSGWDAHGLSENMTIQLNKLSPVKKYKVANINFMNPATRKVVAGAHETFRDLIGLSPGNICTKHELKEVLEHLSNSMYFEKIDFDAKTNPDGTVDLNVPYRERVFPSKTMFRCLSVGMLPKEEPIVEDPNMTYKEENELIKLINRRRQLRHEHAAECILPEQVQDEIEQALRKETSLPSSLLWRIYNRVNKWYQDNGFLFARVVDISNFENHKGKEVIFEVNEGDITKLGVKFVDKMKNTCEGNTNIKVIKRALPDEFAVGRPLNQRAIERALQNITNLNLFSYLEINPCHDEVTGAISAEIKVREHGMSYSIDPEWNIFPGRDGQPKIDWMQPSATIRFGHPNIKGLNRSIDCAMTLSNIFNPAEDGFDYSLSYTHPYLDGIDNPRNRTFQAATFNSTKKLSPVFVRPDDTAPSTRVYRQGINYSTWVDRHGIKATITEDYTKQSKLTYGLVLEDIKTHDVDGLIATTGHMEGPPTTLSGTGNDRLAFLQANLTRDNTRFVNGAKVGARDVFQVDQGIGIGTKFAFFNRAKVSLTRFIPLMKVKEGEGNAVPPTLVLHGLLGHCVGDLPNHEAFTIGGPQSVRGYNFGEIGASRSKLEVAVEVRKQVKNATLYGFAEHGNDLGSSAGLEGNPTKSYRRRGHGSSYGVGIQVGRVRAEYAVDHNKQKGAFFVHFGDRF